VRNLQVCTLLKMHLLIALGWMFAQEWGCLLWPSPHWKHTKYTFAAGELSKLEQHSLTFFLHFQGIGRCSLCQKCLNVSDMR
jgi:hypothetical protein